MRSSAHTFAHCPSLVPPAAAARGFALTLAARVPPPAAWSTLQSNTCGGRGIVPTKAVRLRRTAAFGGKAPRLRRGALRAFVVALFPALAHHAGGNYIETRSADVVSELVRGVAARINRAADAFRRKAATPPPSPTDEFRMGRTKLASLEAFEFRRSLPKWRRGSSRLDRTAQSISRNPARACGVCTSRETQCRVSAPW